MIFPEPVTRKVFFAPLWVFIFGIYLLLYFVVLKNYLLLFCRLERCLFLGCALPLLTSLSLNEAGS
jgi:hypothetical protein